MSEENLDDFLRELQEQIYEDTRRIYGEAVYARWRDPLYMGVIENLDGHGRIAGTCGDTMQIFLRFENERVKEATFLTDGCVSSVACGSFAAELAQGKTPEELADINGDFILEYVGGLPTEDRHCAFLAADTLKNALENYMRRSQRGKIS